MLLPFTVYSNPTCGMVFEFANAEKSGLVVWSCLWPYQTLK